MRPVSVLAAALLTVLVWAGPGGDSANAAAAPASTAHCAVLVTPSGVSGGMRCFTSFRAAISFATGGRVTDAPDDATRAAASPAFAASLAASVVAGIEYESAGYRGATLTLYTSGNCDNSNDADYRVDSFPAGWNDRISSFHTYGICATQLFANTNLGGGAITGLLVNAAGLGTANDRASSLTFN